MNDTWTSAHDLALIFVGLAYGTDHDLKDAEIISINKALDRWSERFDLEDVSEVVVEAITIFMEEDPQANVRRAIKALKKELSQEERQQAIEDVFRVAEADGVVMTAERNLIDALAHAWEVKATRQRLLEETTATVEALPEWSLLHDLGLLYIAFAHSTDNELSDEEIRAIVERIHEWQPELSEKEVRALLREVIEVYSEGPDGEDLEKSIDAIRDKMPRIQRLGVINDLIYVAEADGVFKDAEQEMIRAVSLNLRVGPSGADAE